jgi:hypothetical protein
MLDIIKQAWSAVSASPPTLAALAASISALVALTATAITPFVSIAIAKKQIRANVVSTNRQAWINALRDDLAELFELAIAHFYLREGTLTGEEGFKYGYEQRTRLRRLQNRIRMRLNPDESLSKELLVLIENVRSLSVAKNTDEADAFEQALEDAIVKAQQILRTEWKRVKAGR